MRKIKKKFRTVRLGDIASITRGDEAGSDNYRKYLDKKESDVPFIRTSDLINYEVDDYPDYYVDDTIFSELNQDIREGDILFTKDGKIGLAALVTNADKCVLASGVGIIRVNEKITAMDPDYVFLILSSEIGAFQAMQKSVVAATLPHLQSSRLADIEIPELDPKTMNEISKFVKNAFQLRAEKKKLLREAMQKVELLIEKGEP